MKQKYFSYSEAAKITGYDNDYLRGLVYQYFPEPLKMVPCEYGTMRAFTRTQLARILMFKRNRKTLEKVKSLYLQGKIKFKLI